MYARAVEEAAGRLHELRREAQGDFGLAALALALSFAAGPGRPVLQLPLLVGAFAGFVRGVRAAWLRWELVDRLTLDRDAHAIPEIRRRAARFATMERRRDGADSLRRILGAPDAAIAPRVAAVREDLEALADDLENEELRMDAAAAVACDRLVTDGLESPLLSPAPPADELRSRVLQLRAAFEPRAGEPGRATLEDAA